jgi:hypothetical protein
MSHPDFLAPTGSPLGHLQRGRGEGFRRIHHSSADEAHELITKCITCDPRLDFQVESRDYYYASIAIAVDLPLEPLAESLRTGERLNPNSQDTALTVDTLSELAKRDYKNSRDILCDYIEWGDHWNRLLGRLTRHTNDELHSRMAHAVERRFPTEDQMDKRGQPWAREAFTTLSDYSSRIKASVAKASEGTAPKSDESFPDLTSVSPRRLLDLTNEHNFRRFGKAMAEAVTSEDIFMLVAAVSLENPHVSHVALAGLKQLAPPSLCSWLLELWSAIAENRASDDRNSKYNRVILRQAISRTVLALPAELTLPFARYWIFEEAGQNRRLAENLLQEHARAEDIPMLRKFLGSMLTDEEKEWGCFLIKAFNHFPNIGVVPELLQIYYHFRFSTGRAYSVEAIQITSPEFFQQNLALECLWDCEEATRAIGAKSALLESDEARQRLCVMAEDRFEDQTVSAAARDRLKVS